MRALQKDTPSQFGEQQDSNNIQAFCACQDYLHHNFVHAQQCHYRFISCYTLGIGLVLYVTCTHKVPSYNLLLFIALLNCMNAKGAVSSNMPASLNFNLFSISCSSHLPPVCIDCLFIQ